MLAVVAFVVCCTLDYVQVFMAEDAPLAVLNAIIVLRLNSLAFVCEADAQVTMDKQELSIIYYSLLL